MVQNKFNQSFKDLIANYNRERFTITKMTYYVNYLAHITPVSKPNLI